MQIDQAPSAAMLDALQAVETLLQEASREVFITNLSPGRFKKFGALIESFPFRLEVPTGFQLWWDCSEPMRRKWLEQVEDDDHAKRGSHFALANLRPADLAPDAQTIGSYYQLMASKDELGRIGFSKPSSAWLCFGTQAHTFRHNISDFVNMEPERTA
jgi:hypothetical protein